MSTGHFDIFDMNYGLCVSRGATKSCGIENAYRRDSLNFWICYGILIFFIQQPFYHTCHKNLFKKIIQEKDDIEGY